MTKWITTKFPGVRYREHKSRKHGIKKDKYFSIRYTLDGKQIEEGIGWATAGWTTERVSEELSRLKRSQRTGKGAQSLSEARKIENRRRQAEAERKKRDAIKAITLDQFWEKHYLPHQLIEKKKQTMRTEASYYKNWIRPLVGNKQLSQITTFDLERVKKKLRDAGRAPKTIRDNYALVRQIINRAETLDMYSGKNPFRLIKKEDKPKTGDNRRDRYLTHEESEILLKALAEKSPDLHDMAMLALDCAPRAGEIFGLDWRDIDLERGVVTFRKTKNNKVRHIPMTQRVREMFQARKAGAQSEIVFPARENRRKKEVSNTFAAVVEDLGLNAGVADRLNKVVFHTLRHTCASWLANARVPIFTIKEYLGHSQISQTVRYSHLDPQALKEATVILNNMGKKNVKNVANLSI